METNAKFELHAELTEDKDPTIFVKIHSEQISIGEYLVLLEDVVKEIRKAEVEAFTEQQERNLVNAEVATLIKEIDEKEGN